MLKSRYPHLACENPPAPDEAGIVEAEIRTACNRIARFTKIEAVYL